ncbi:site-specific integrase [Paucilactobacillus hokkaidonensis]|uniref:site-specific integrase n=1 Tax=Paucilactobacillus hokkaidonensis TaxID=1193095 RepID=UPI0009E1B116|nr:site-specific integrase [Paucilactobacillus hokkaidonensis]
MDLDLVHHFINVIHSLDRDENLQSTKENKKTRFQITPELAQKLQIWKDYQNRELDQFDIEQNDDQLVFTFTNSKGEINQPVIPEYLNNRLNTIKKHHPELAKTHPHALRHTFATLAKEGGATMEDISKALTHSDEKTTRLYVDEPNVVDLSAQKKFAIRLDQERNAN